MPSSKVATPTSGPTRGISERLVSSFAAWRVAARTHTLPAAVVPVLVGGGLARSDDAFRWVVFALTLVATLAIQIAANFANDVSDARRGADVERLGPPRMVAQGVITPRRMWAGVGIAIGVAGAAGIALAIVSSPVVIWVGLASVVAMLGYVGGPFPYGYRGLGELFVFVFFGLVATVGSRYVHDLTAPADAWLLAVPVGMLVTSLLVANNYRDIDTDRAAGKRTLSVIIGRGPTRGLFSALVIGSFLAIAGFALVGWTPMPTIAAVLLAPLARGPILAVNRRTDGPSLVGALKSTARLYFLVGLVIAVGSAI